MTYNDLSVFQSRSEDGFEKTDIGFDGGIWMLMGGRQVSYDMRRYNRKWQCRIGSLVLIKEVRFEEMGIGNYNFIF